MTEKQISASIERLIAAGNAFDTEAYLSLYHPDAVLDDPSVGRIFKEHQSIREYFEAYFIGYKTQTVLKKLTINNNHAYLEVTFTGNFPKGTIGGMFDLRFSDGKIIAAKADLL